MIVKNVHNGRGVGYLKLYNHSTAQGLSYQLLVPERMVDTTNGSVEKLNNWELGLLEIRFRDSREIDEFITVLEQFKRQIQAGLGKWENDWRLR